MLHPSALGTLPYVPLSLYQESLKHHNLDPVQILTDFYRYVEIALDPGMFTGEKSLGSHCSIFF